jgi:hypothetical protein
VFLFATSAASNFLAARDAVVTALLCYAKITPAALHCNEIGWPCRDGDEAAGRKPEFRVSNFIRITERSAARSCGRSGWHRLEQSVPDA